MSHITISTKRINPIGAIPGVFALCASNLSLRPCPTIRYNINNAYLQHITTYNSKKNNIWDS